MRIGVDFDGVIADASSVKIALAKKKYGLVFKPEETTGAVMRPFIGDKEYILFRQEVNQEYTLKNTVVPGCKSALASLISEGHKIVVLTGRYAHEERFAKKFLKINKIPYNHFFYVAEDTRQTYKRTLSKLAVIDQLNLKVMIDDYCRNLIKMTGRGISLFLFDQPWNRKDKVNTKEITRVFGWQDALKRIRVLSEKELVRV